MINTAGYPDFIVIGPQKCGTTTLHGLIRQHPDVFLPDEKETHYFACGGTAPAFTDSAARLLNSEAIWRREDYEALFAASDAPVKGEVCPTYLYAPGAAELIAESRPETKIVAILRDPISRSFSAYRYMKALGAETASSFAEALDAEASHVAQNWQPMSHYLTASLYHPQLKRYFDRFPREQVLILDFAQLSADPIGVANTILAYVGSTPLPGGVTMAQTNRTVVPKSRLGRLLMEQPTWIRRARKLLPQEHRGRIKEWLLSRLPSDEEKLSAEWRDRLVPVFRQDVAATRTLTGLAFETWTV